MKKQFMKKQLVIFVLIMTTAFSSVALYAEKLTPVSEEFTAISKEINREITDIDNHWAVEAINKIVDKDVFVDEEGRFYPEKAITRSEFVMMLHKALGIEIMYFKAPDITEIFDDVKNEDVYASALIDLVTANIIDYKGKFNPDETITRDEMVHYIINSLKYMTGGQYALIMIMPEPFTDDEDINPAYKQDLIEAQILKIAVGRSNNYFHPKDKATRAEAATLIYRLKEVLKNMNTEVQVIPSAEVSEDSLKLKLMIVNNLDKAVTIRHWSGQKFDFVLLDSDRNELYRWSADKFFIAALTETTINAGKSVEFSVDVEEELFKEIKGKIAYMKAYITGESDEFQIDGDGYETEIIFE